jgi:hypothetical protein
MPVCITRSFGRDAITKGVPQWLAALAAGQERARKCGHIKKTGEPCRKTVMRGATKCASHLQGDERLAATLTQEKRALRLVNSSNARHRAKATATLRAIERRRLQLHWRQQNPDAHGTTLILPPVDERRLRQHLQRVHNLDIDNYVHETLEPQRGLSARAIDRIRYAGVLELSNRITPQAAGNRVRAAIRDDVRWFAKHGW